MQSNLRLLTPRRSPLSCRCVRRRSSGKVSAFITCASPSHTHNHYPCPNLRRSWRQLSRGSGEETAHPLRGWVQPFAHYGGGMDAPFRIPQLRRCVARDRETSTNHRSFPNSAEECKGEANAMKKAAIYVRVSTAGQHVESQGIRPTEACRAARAGGREGVRRQRRLWNKSAASGAGCADGGCTAAKVLGCACFGIRPRCSKHSTLSARRGRTRQLRN